MASYRVSVRAKPGARRAAITRLPDSSDGQPAYLVAVAEPALDGRANRAIERALARHLGLPVSHLRVVMGVRSRDKVVEVVTRLST